jgi:hypothetical protein
MDPEGGRFFVRKEDSTTVRFLVQWLDVPEVSAKYTSVDEIERTNHSTVT